jgi:hypothetical protein
MARPALHKDAIDLLYEGASAQQISIMMKVPPERVRNAIKENHIAPVARRSSSIDIYCISEVVPYLLKPAMSDDEYIQKMKHSDLPPTVRKEFWAAMRSRQLYEIEAGDLWPTDRVQEHIISMFKLVNLSLRQMADQVERETSVTDSQRSVIIRLCDETLRNMDVQIRQMIDEMPERTKPGHDLLPANSSFDQPDFDEDDDD